MISFLLFPNSASSQRPSPPSTCSREGKTECSIHGPFTYPTIQDDGQFMTITTNMCPPYTNSKWTNPGQACEFSTTYKIPLNPKQASTPIPLAQKLKVFENITYLKEDPKPMLGPIGVLFNGVNIFGVGSPCGYSSKCPSNGGPSQYVDAVESEGHTVDPCGGHPAPTHQYHVHSGVGMTTNELRQSCKLPIDEPKSHSELLGWMFDGYGLYGRYSTNGWSCWRF